MLTNVIHRWDDIINLKAGRKVLPHFVDFHTSNICNQNCKGCAYSGGLDGTWMDEESHFYAVLKFIQNGVDAFDFAGGGEPTLIPYLPRLFRTISENDAHFALITNGTNLTDELIDAIVHGATYCRISLEASSEKQYQAYKNSGAWSTVMDGIMRLCSARRRIGAKLEISLKFSVGKSLRGEDHYRNMFVLAESLGVDRISMKCLRHEPEELSFSDRYQEWATFMKMSPRTTKYKIVSSLIPNREQDIPQCWLNPLHTVMDHLGNLYICCYYYFRENDFLIGNILSQNFEDIWFSDLHRKKIQNINRMSCYKVDCKFFAHHKAVDEMMQRGQVYFL